MGHKCKLRLTKIHQFIIRSRKLALSIQPKLVRIWKPYERQQRNRERKAEIAAKISNVVKSELLERLHEGVYEGIYNFPQRQFQDVLTEKGKEEDEEDESEDNDKEVDIVGVIESDLEEEDEDDYESEEDIEELQEPQLQRQYEYEFEYENEMGAMTQMQTASSNTKSFITKGYQKRTSSSNRNDRNNNKNKKSVLGKRKSVTWKDQKKKGWNKHNRKKQKIGIGYD